MCTGRIKTVICYSVWNDRCKNAWLFLLKQIVFELLSEARKSRIWIIGRRWSRSADAVRETEGGRHSAQAVDRTAREHPDVPGNEALPQGPGAVVFQKVQVTQDVTDIMAVNIAFTIKTWSVSSYFLMLHRTQINPPRAASERIQQSTSVKRNRFSPKIFNSGKTHARLRLW